MKNTSLKNPLLLLLTAVIWGVAFVAQSVGMDYVGAFTFNFTRCLIGAVVLIPCIFFLDRLKGREGKTGKEKREGGTASGATAIKSEKANAQARTGLESREDKTAGTGETSQVETGRETAINRRSAAKNEAAEKGRKNAVLIGGICCGVALFVASNLQQFGIKYTTVGKAGFITALYIVLVPILGIFLKKKVGLKIWISVALAVVGLYLLCITDGFSIGTGDFLVLLCAFVFSVHILVIDYFSPKADGVRMSCIQFFVCSILSGVGMLLFEKPSFSAILQAWVPILYAGVMSCGVAYTLQIVGQKGTDPTVASLILSLESVVSVLAGWVILGQQLSAKELFGCVLMLGAIILAQLPEKRARAE